MSLMGITGTIAITPALKEPHKEYLHAFMNTRRLKLLASDASSAPDPLRAAVGLPIGHEGEHFVGALDDSFVIDWNLPPSTQPTLWCLWELDEDSVGVPDDDCTYLDTTLEADEDPALAIEWLRYLLVHFFIPWGYIVNGEAIWHGNDYGDLGMVTVQSNVVTLFEADWSAINDAAFKKKL